MKLLKILSFLILSIFLFNLVSAVIFDAEWSDGSQIATITNGQSINLIIPDGGSMNPPVTMTIKLDSNTIYTNNNFNFPDPFLFTITPSYYNSQSGIYEISVVGTDSFGSWPEFLTLKVNPASQDTTPPVITLLGANPQIIQQGDPYLEQGATAWDNVDGDLTSEIIIDASDVYPNIAGTYTVTYTVSDSSANTAVKIRTVEVVQCPPQNNPPVITSSPVTQVNENQYYSYNVDATDLDGDILTYSLIKKPSWLSINPSTGLITGTANEVDSDTGYSVKVKVSDGEDYDIQSYVLTVKNVPCPPQNNPPVITSTPDTQINENQYYSYNVDATDLDGDVLIYSLVKAPPWLSINQNTGVISGTVPEVDYDESHTIKVKVSDGKAYDIQIYTLTVKDTTCPPQNHAPVITSTPVITSVNEKTLYTYQVTATDSDGDSLTYSLTQKPSWLSINSNTGLITGTAPEVYYNKYYTIKVKVSDGEDYDTQTYVLTVKNVLCPSENHAPVITSTPVTKVDEGEQYIYDVEASDEDGDVLTYSLLQKPCWLSINSNTGLISGTAPEVDYDESHTIKVKVSDGEDYDIQTFTLKVRDEDDNEDDDSDSSSYDIYGDSYYEQLYWDQFKPKTIYIAEEEEEETLNWFQKLIRAIVNFFERLFGLK